MDTKNVPNTQQNGYQNNPNTLQMVTKAIRILSKMDSKVIKILSKMDIKILKKKNGYQNNLNTQQNGYQSNTNTQQNGHQNSQITQQTTQQNVHQSPVGSGNQNVYASHQNSEDLGQTFATAVSLPQYASSTQNHQQISSSHSNKQPIFCKLVQQPKWLFKSKWTAKQINYTPSIQESLQLQGNAGQPFAYVSLPSNYKSDFSSSGVVTSKIAHTKQSQTSFSNDESSEATGSRFKQR
ncbi:hypothetical protein CEXT_419411 [Caerostris extrusa]|uniref:Uncharacterized protein n=1 Tax=Caerostris extrusa TaxID=172846 RepID=A0AAV4MMV0_CAEEX|nr:hypothetical protein CEXT_419411 [Caerostris extrusa]